MSFSLSENWDSATAPALPGSWDADAEFVTSTTRSLSSPNGLTLGSGTANTKYYATYSVADTGGGATFDLTTHIYVDTVSVPGNYNIGPTFRCSSSSMDNSTTSCYWMRLNYLLPSGAQQMHFSKVVNGTVTNLYTVYCGTGEITTGQWFALRVVCAGSDTFNVSFTRMSDGWMMDQFGVFGASSAACIVNFVDNDIASGDYYGVCAECAATNSRVYVDDAVVNASGTSVILTPRKPHVVRPHFRFYRPE